MSGRRIGRIDRRGIPAIPAALTAVFLTLAMCSCGDDRGGSIAIRIGDSAISAATVDRWTGVVRRGGAFTGFRGAPERGTPRQRAEALLISSHWLIAEARRQRLPIVAGTVNQLLAERMQGASGAELRRSFEATGQTVAGTKLELEAELAFEAIDHELKRRAEQITPKEVMDFYRADRPLFSGHEVRVIDIVEHLPSAAAAKALVRRTGTGRRFAKIAIHKEIARTTGLLNGPQSKKAVDDAIFTARPGVMSPPMRFFDGWTVFVVRRIIAPRSRPLADVRQDVFMRLKERRKRTVTEQFDNEYRNRWMARTQCRRGFTAPGCAEYAGRLETYEDPFSAF
jgi:hypothetical protein